MAKSVLCVSYWLKVSGRMASSHCRLSDSISHSSELWFLFYIFFCSVELFWNLEEIVLFNGLKVYGGEERTPAYPLMSIEAHFDFWIELMSKRKWIQFFIGIVKLKPNKSTKPTKHIAAAVLIYSMPRRRINEYFPLKSFNWLLWKQWALRSV